MKKINVRNLAISFILILSLTLGAGCDLLPKADTSLPSTPPATNNATTTDNTSLIDSDWSIPLTESQAPILPSIADVVAKVKPSVVAINTEVITAGFYNQPFTQQGAGSGWIISEDGYVVTNNHVVEGAESITVTLDDGRTFAVDMNAVATDSLTDLAILRIDAENLPAVSVGDSSGLRVGDWVIAIGNSLGQGIGATNGIVSALGISIDVSSGQTLRNLIQTDAAINPGNSGGPLVNMAGEVVGITSVKIAEVGVEGMGYAISTNEATPIIQQLINTGYVVRPWLGVNLYTVDQFVVWRYNLAVDEGTLVTYVSPGGPADKAGLKAGDVITKFEDQEITEDNELQEAVFSSQIGQEVEITFWRGKTKDTTYATLVESPKPS